MNQNVYGPTKDLEYPRNHDKLKKKIKQITGSQKLQGLTSIYQALL